MIVTPRRPLRAMCRNTRICASLLAIAAIAEGADAKQIHRVSTFQSSGKTVHVDELVSLTAPRPALVILLHGSGGLASPNFPYKGLAGTLANRGFAVHMPHYFDAAKASVAGRDQPYNIWTKALRDEVEGLRDRSDINPNKTVIIGFSLGASVALAAVSAGVGAAAVVDCAGSLPDASFRNIHNLPPLLILHNRGDSVMPFYNAEQLLQLCDERHFVCEARFGDSAEHGLPPPEAESINRIADFTAAHLR